MIPDRIAFTLPIGMTLGASNIWSAQLAGLLAARNWQAGLLVHENVGWHPETDLEVGPGVQVIPCRGARVTEATADDVERYARAYGGALPGIVVQNWGRASYGALACLARDRAYDLRVIGVGHTDSEPYYAELCYYERIIHIFLAVSDEIAGELRRRLPHRVDDIVVRPCAVFAPAALGRSYAPSGRPLCITYAGRVTNDQKKMSRVAPLMQELDRRGVNFHLRIIGEGGYKIWLKSDVQKLPPALQARVSIEGGRKPADMPAIWAESDICLLVSDFEGTSVSMMEAMAQGCVPVVTKVSGTGAIIQAGQNGFVAPPGDLAAMAGILCTLDQQREKLPALGQAAHQTIVDRYSYDCYVPWFLEVLDRTKRMPSRPWDPGRPVFVPEPALTPAADLKQSAASDGPGRGVRLALGGGFFLTGLYGLLVLVLWLAHRGWLPGADRLLSGRSIHGFGHYWAYLSRYFLLLSGGLVAGSFLAVGLRWWVRRVGGWRRFWPRFAFSVMMTLLLAEVVLRMALLNPQLPLRPLQDPNLVASSFSDEAWWVLGYRHGFSGLKLAEIAHPLLGTSQEPPSEDNPLGLYARTRERLGASGPRVLFFGDSFVHGMPFNKIALPEMVEAQLADDRPVANMGVRGYGLDQIYLLAHELGVPRRGDTILVGVLTWDIDRTVFSFMFGQKPRFVIEDGALRLSNIPFPASNQEFLRSFKVSYPSFLVQALKRKWARLRNLDLVAGGQAEEKRQITKAILTQWSREIALAGAQMTVVLFHTRQDLATRDWRNDVVREACGELGVPLLDTADVLLPYLRERNSYGDELYEAKDFHHTDLANQLIAGQIVRNLAKSEAHE